MTEVNVCPNCGAKGNLDYSEVVVEMNGVRGVLYYPWKCYDCNRSGKEYYIVQFETQEINT